MDQEAEQEHRREQISRPFALLTGKLEDAATLAVEGQGPQSDQALVALAEQIAGLAGKSAIISGALAVLLAAPSHQTGAE
ncbi:MAG: hypothetical protein ABIT16_01140 [Croceibacterium sp.]